jgi:hypothetical protein
MNIAQVAAEATKDLRLHPATLAPAAMSERPAPGFGLARRARRSSSGRRPGSGAAVPPSAPCAWRQRPTYRRYRSPSPEFIN